MKKLDLSLIKILMCLLIFFFFTACNLVLNIVDEVSLTRSEDKTDTGPRVINVNPVNGALDVNTNAAIIISFDRNMNTAVTGKILFHNPEAQYDTSNATIQFESMNQESDTVRIIPHAPLPGGMIIYGISIRNFQDLRNRPMSDYEDPAYLFTTRIVNETEPPNIVALSPADGDGSVEIDANLVIQFNESLDSGICGQVQLTYPGINYEDGLNCSLTFSQTVYINDTVTINPYTNFGLNANYSEITVSGFYDSAGNQMNSYYDSIYNFTSRGIGLLAYYPFDGNASDASGNGNDATIFGNTSPDPDRFGNTGSAYYLDGSGDYLEAYVNELSGDFTLTAWVRPDSAPANPCAVLAKQTAPGLPEICSTEFVLRLETYNINSYMGNGSGYGLEIDANGDSSPDLGANEWHHLAMVTEGATTTLYLDGYNAGSQIFSGSRQYGSYPVLIGMHEDEGGLQYFKGTVDEVRIYNYALTYGEISSMFGFECPPPPVVTAILSPPDSAKNINVSTSIVLQFDQSLFTSATGNIHFSTPGLTFSDGVNCSVTYSSTVYPNDTVTIFPAFPLTLGQTLGNISIDNFYDVRQVAMLTDNDPTYNFTPAYLTIDGIGDPGTELGNDIIIDGNGKLLIAGQSISGGYTDALLARFTPAGENDLSLEGDGYVIVNYDGDGLSWDDMFNAVEMDGSNRIVAAGSSFGNTTDHNLILARYFSNGNPDTSFGGTGIIHHDYTGNGFDNYEYAYDIFIDSTNGFIYAVGEAESAIGTDIILWKYDFYGNPFNSFNSYTTHYLVLSMSSDNYLESGRAIHVDTATGDIYIAGKAYNAANLKTNACLIKLSSEGIPDSSFDGDGWAFFGNTTEGEGFFDMVMDADNKLVLTGSYPSGADTDMMVIRYDLNGSRDMSLDGMGWVMDLNGFGDDAGYGIAIDGNGRIVITGTFCDAGDNEAAIWRLNPDGTFDNSFAADGLRILSNPGFDAGYALAIDGSNRIYATGQFFNGTDAELLLACVF